MTPLLRKFLGLNWLLFANMLALLVFGVCCIYSACWMREGSELVDKWRDQVVLIIIGLVFFFATSLIDYRWVFKLGLPFYIGGLLMLVITMFFGTEVNATKGWLYLGPFSIQTSQVAIAGGIVMMALILATLHKKHPFFRSPFVRLMITGIAGGIPCALVFLQGDLGSGLVWFPVIGVMVLIGNIPFRYLTVIFLSAAMVVPFGYFFALKDYQKKRITVQIDMLMGKKVDVQNEAYNAYYNLLAIGSGGWTGKGFKNKDTVNNKNFISPTTAINDFIFAVLSEEFGFRGSLMMLAGFALLLLQCLYVAFYSKDVVGRLMVVGVVGLLFAHIFQNVGMNLLIMPITGIPLPLISYGGTFVVIVLFLLGLVQSVWIHRAEYSSSDPRPAMNIEGLD
ncbi:MAG: FtsW/RodA/SpoVE family cell cycle protein [Verrucomicrobiota bacterium]